MQEFTQRNMTNSKTFLIFSNVDSAVINSQNDRDMVIKTTVD